MIYDQPFNTSFSKKIESIQYKAALVIKGAIKGSSHLNIFIKEDGQEDCLLYKVFSTGQPSYVYDLLPSMRSPRRLVNSFNTVSSKAGYFKKSFIPNVINEWNKLDPDIRSSASCNLFGNSSLKVIRPVQRKTFNIND